MSNLRLKFISVFFFILFLLIIARLFYWQVLAGDKLAEIGENQHFITLDLPSARGKILSSDKTPLVTNENAYLLYADLRNIKKNKDKIVKDLAPFLISEKEKEKIASLLSLLNQENAVWVPLAHKLSENQKNNLIKLKIAGLGFEEEAKRFYPEASMSAHLLGFVGKDSLGYDQGYFGLEGKYDLELKGQNGKLITEKDALNRPILLGMEEKIEARNGRSLVTTIDKYSQRQAEIYLKEGLSTWGAKAGNIIVMNPRSGAILAMAGFPSYDPANYENFADMLYKNPGTSETFEPGSIMKPIIMSMALNENKLKPETRCPQCAGPRLIGGYQINTFNNQYHPHLTMTEVLINSDNTGMVYVSDLLGKKLISDYLHKYEFGKTTGIDLEEEEGSIKPIDSWYPIDTATVAFGQGIAVTPLQMIRAFAVIANGGKLVKPYLVQSLMEENKEIDISPHVEKRIIKEETAKVITEMLVAVNRESPLRFPLERTPSLKDYRIAAKSGTAQIPISGHYEENKTIGSVIGFAPADDPKFVVLVKLVEPTVRPWGSDTAGPIFYNLVADLLSYYGIPP